MLNKEVLFVWDLIIVFFLYGGMKAEEDNAVLKQETKGLTMKDVIGKNYAVIRWDAKLNALYALMKTSREHTIITKNPQGVYCVVNVFDQKALKSAGSVSDISAEIPSIQSSSNISDALSKIEAVPFRIGVVLNGKKLMGIATGSTYWRSLRAHGWQIEERL